MAKTTQEKLVLEYYEKFPGKDIPHKEAVDWLLVEYENRTGNKLRDPDRQIRSLHQKGILVKVKKGVYKYDPELVSANSFSDFTDAQKKAILERDGHVCAVCGRGPNDGYELHIDHIKPRKLGGTSDVENGQVLCSMHNMMKKYYKQTETGKRMFINLLRLAKRNNDTAMKDFIEDILKVFDNHDVNGHIKWD